MKALQQCCKPVTAGYSLCSCKPISGVTLKCVNFVLTNLTKFASVEVQFDVVDIFWWKHYHTALTHFRATSATYCIIKLSPPQQCKTVHQVHCGGGEGWRPALSRHPSPGCPVNGEDVQGPLQLWQGLKPEWRSTGMPVRRGTGEVSACRACMGDPSPNQVGGDHSGWPGQNPQEGVAERSNPHPAAQPPPPTGMGDWSCLDAGWQPWEQESRGDLPHFVARSYAPSCNSKWCDAWL